MQLTRSRNPSSASEIAWDPVAGTLDADAIEGFEAVVHLAGESIVGRWTAPKKARIRDSRVLGTQLLANTLTRLRQPPQVLVAASATGVYGDRGDEVLDEDSPPGAGFLASVCREWEAATEPASSVGIRVVNLRFGLVLSPKGGALARMLLPFRCGLGGVIGSGRQYMSWVAIDDAVAVILHALMNHSLRGPVNTVAPEAVTSSEFSRMLGRVLRRPTWLPLPAFLLRLILGEMADEVLLASARVVPARLRMSGYQFRLPEVEPALRHLLT